jgi:hypothetical protein
MALGPEVFCSGHSVSKKYLGFSPRIVNPKRNLTQICLGVALLNASSSAVQPVMTEVAAEANDTWRLS